ncbi:phage virion morphogenesis protein [Pseudomonas lalucatii]|nr:phage virion morphogenesis protein [Pseudomonas lalucatii]
MADDLSALEDWAGALLAKLEPKARRQLNQGLARELRHGQQQRIAAQRNPDGTPSLRASPASPCAARPGASSAGPCSPSCARPGTSLQSDAGRIAIGFLGRTARLARVHQYGLRDRPGRGASEVQYARRQLLGLTAADLELIRDRLLDHLAD